MKPRTLLLSPFALAVLVTLVNVAKPVTVDDAWYLRHARHIAEHPFDPYGFPGFWYAKYDPAMEVLSPPVVPYWLAGGIALFGESLPLLKLWLFPFVWLLAWSLHSLLKRFACGAEAIALPLLILSPAVLPTVNLMLDVPAIALALTAIEVFIRASIRRNWLLALFAGVLAAFAMQTKYTAFVAPAVFAWYAFTHRRFALAFLAVGVCVALFAGWELLLVAKYEQSHFLFHAQGATGPPPEGESRLSAFLNDKVNLIPPLVGYFGCLAVGVGLFAGAVLRISRRWLVAVAGVWWVGLALICALPHQWTVIEGHLTATSIFWEVSGWCWLAAVAGCAGVLLFRVKRGLAPRLNTDSWFLVGWFAIEIAATLALTPFPAARRVIGLTLVAGLLAARAASRISLAHVPRTPPNWVLALGILAGVVVAGIDTFDAFPEKVCAERAAEVTRDRREGSTVWYVGHWGFQYYCEREGMMPLIAGETVVRERDFVVIPVYPDEGFNRPWPGFTVREPLWAGEEIAVIEWNDWLSARSVPNFYGGMNPVVGRDHPRLRVRVYRMRTDWAMGR
jgi:hypothetical protein